VNKTDVNLQKAHATPIIRGKKAHTGLRAQAIKIDRGKRRGPDIDL
jgi:hypothetical protein